MSDLANLFAQRRKPSTPVKKLFNDEFSTGKKRTQTRSRQPNKSIRKNKFEHQNHVSLLKAKDFAKRYVQKSDIKKDILHYNQQVLLAFIRKMFFIMGGVILFNLIFTSAHQWTLLSNMMLAIAFVDINLENHHLGRPWFKIGKQIVRALAYCINFYILFLEIHPQRSSSSYFDAEVMLVSGNAAVNYITMTFCQPFVGMVRMRNYKQPYVSLFQRMNLQLTEFCLSLSTLYCFIRPIVLSNLVYWLFAVFYVVYEKSYYLLDNLLTIPSLLTFISATILLYVYLYLIEKINIAISIDLLSSNKKTVNISILRLDSQKIYNEAIIGEIIKYIWKNPEMMWDIEFISHLYSINYDVLEDFLNFQLTAMNEKILEVTRFLQFEGKYSQKQSDSILPLAERVKSNIKQINKIYHLAAFIIKKQYLFYIIQHIAYFESLTSDFPINIQSLLRKMIKIDSSLKLLSENIKFLELRHSICHFCTYFHERILSPLTQS